MSISVDTHKKTHVLVTINAQGQTCGTHTVTNTPSGWATVLRWALKVLTSMVDTRIEPIARTTISSVLVGTSSLLPNKHDDCCLRRNRIREESPPVGFEAFSVFPEVSLEAFSLIREVSRRDNRGMSLVGGLYDGKFILFR